MRPSIAEAHRLKPMLLVVDVVLIAREAVSSYDRDPDTISFRYMSRKIAFVGSVAEVALVSARPTCAVENVTCRADTIEGSQCQSTDLLRSSAPPRSPVSDQSARYATKRQDTVPGPSVAP